MEEHEVQSIIVIGEIEREYIMPILCKFHKDSHYWIYPAAPMCHRFNAYTQKIMNDFMGKKLHQQNDN